VSSERTIPEVSTFTSKIVEHVTVSNNCSVMSVNSDSLRFNKVDDDYFGGYSTRHIHELMLRDVVRTEAYRDFMYQNTHLFKDKVVLDVGCGTGILSMFAAKAGAKRVVGVDAADIIDKTSLIIKRNKLDHIISLVKSKVEEAVLPSDVEASGVDIIISEWMGYMLLYESMLPSVLFARDKWMKQQIAVEDAPCTGIPPIKLSGGVYPNEAIMYFAGCELQFYKEKTEWFWKDVYGFNMDVLIDPKETNAGSMCDVYPMDCLITDQVVMKSLDMMTVQSRDLDFTCDLILKFQGKQHRSISPSTSSTFDISQANEFPLEAFILYFDTIFSLGCTNVITLPTGPAFTPTHWKQTMFKLNTCVLMHTGDFVECSVKCTRRKKNERHYDVQIRYRVMTSPETVTPASSKVENETNDSKKLHFSPGLGTSLGKKGEWYVQDFKVE
jgi:protein arginine N-methyltransferase 1